MKMVQVEVEGAVQTKNRVQPKDLPADLRKILKKAGFTATVAMEVVSGGSVLEWVLTLEDSQGNQLSYIRVENSRASGYMPEVMYSDSAKEYVTKILEKSFIKHQK